MNEPTKNPMTDIPKFKIGIQIIALVTALYFVQFVIYPLYDSSLSGSSGITKYMGEILLFGGDALVALIGMCILFNKIERWRFSHVMFAIGIWLLADLLYFLFGFCIYDGGKTWYYDPPRWDDLEAKFVVVAFNVGFFMLNQIIAAVVIIIAHFIKKLYIRIKQK